MAINNVTLHLLLLLSIALGKIDHQLEIDNSSFYIPLQPEPGLNYIINSLQIRI